MPKQILADTFEGLEQTIKQAGKQLVKLPGEMAEEAAKQVGIKPEPGVEQLQGDQGVTARIAQRKKAARRRLTYLLTELEALKQRRAQELPKQISGKPGFSEERAIKQIEIKKEDEKKPPPIVGMLKKKGGTGERKIMGVGG